MKKTKTLSVVIPTYNRADILLYTLSLFERQIQRNGDEVELIVCDNASTDSTAELVDDYIKTHPFFHFIKYPVHVDVGDSITRCIDNASGKFFVVFGDDDLPAPYMVDIILLELNKYPEIGVLLCNRLKGNTRNENKGVENLCMDGAKDYQRDVIYYADYDEFLQSWIHAMGFISIVVLRLDIFKQRLKETFPNNHMGWNFYAPYVYAGYKMPALYISYPLCIRRIPPIDSISLHHWSGQENNIFLLGKARALHRLGELGVIEDWQYFYNRYEGNMLDIVILVLRGVENGTMQQYADEICEYQNLRNRKLVCNRMLRTHGIVQKWWILWYKITLWVKIVIMGRKPQNQKYL